MPRRRSTSCSATRRASTGWSAGWQTAASWRRRICSTRRSRTSCASTSSGRLDEARAAEALADLHALPLERHPAQPLLGRIWELRHNLSAYDATYVALAEALDAVLITSDQRLLDLPGSVSPATIETRQGSLPSAAT